MKRLLLATALFTLPVAADAQGPTVMGTWLTAAKTAQVRLTPCADARHGPVCGTIVSLTDPKGPDGKPIAPDAALDFRNSDPTLKTRKILGMVLLYGFKNAAEPNSFEEGTIYSAENGKTYKANISLQADGTLRLRGYVGSPMFGETQIWTRVQ